jgi:hypothetical protein
MDLRLSGFLHIGTKSTVVLDLTGVGGHAKTYEKLSLEGYPHVCRFKEKQKHDKYDADVPAEQLFVPVVMEVQGGFGEEAEKFFKKILGEEFRKDTGSNPSIPLRRLRMTMMSAFRKAHIRCVLQRSQLFRCGHGLS